jgi:hypothetical protein
MPQWLRNLTLLVVLGTWLTVVGFTLYRGELPNAAVLGIPAAVVVALAPPIAIGRSQRRRSQQQDDEDTP